MTSEPKGFEKARAAREVMRECLSAEHVRRIERHLKRDYLRKKASQK